MESRTTYPISVVDVFAEERLAGNQLAIVHNAASLSDEQMQSIALKTNYSETTFVTEVKADRATVRIFTPAFELPFAGHPTVGTAWELTGGEGEIILDLPVGPVPVTFDQGIGWMVPPAVSFNGTIDREQAAQLINLNNADLADDFPIALAEVGPKFVIIPVRSLETLRRASLNAQLHSELIDQGAPVQCVFVISAEPYDPSADFATRMFFNSAGLREDPATGSANAAFAAYLRRESGRIGRVIVDQGVEIGRPSRLYLQVDDELAVGGKVQGVINGSLTV